MSRAERSANRAARRELEAFVQRVADGELPRVPEEHDGFVLVSGLAHLQDAARAALVNADAAALLARARAEEPT